MEELNELKKQFFSAMGINVFDDNYGGFDSEFLDWKRERIAALGDFVYFLEDRGYDFQNKNTAEIGKSGLDSAVIPFESKVITPYTDQFETNTKNFDQNRIVNGTMIIENADPIVVNEDDGFEEYVSISKNIDTFITHNPYSDQNIRDWAELHNSSLYNIIIGVYGNIYDCDYSSKIKSLQRIKQILIDDYYREDFCISSDKYFYVIGTDYKFYRARNRINN